MLLPLSLSLSYIHLFHTWPQIAPTIVQIERHLVKTREYVIQKVEGYYNGRVQSCYLPDQMNVYTVVATHTDLMVVLIPQDNKFSTSSKGRQAGSMYQGTLDHI